MAKTATPIDITEDQVLYFRAARGQLAGPGASSPVAAARTLLGAQSQQLPPSLLSLSLRTKSRPTAATLKKQLFASPRKLVRTWGPRGTLFIFDPADWPLVVSARGQLGLGGRGGPMPATATIDKALAYMEKAKDPVTRSDVVGIAPKAYVRELAERATLAGLDPDRLAAARLFWCLSLRGDACLGDKVGAEQAYAARSAWFPKLAWKPRTPDAAAAELARRYLAVHGPATAKDVAHFFGAKVTDARKWLEAIDGHLVPVSCGDRKGLVALEADVADLTAKPPSAAARWPLRLLPLWEAMLMAHADKSWTVPEEAERTLVWRKAAYVCAVAIDRGRVVATWAHTEKRGRLAVEVRPLSRWRAARHLAPVKREAAAVAAHLGVAGADVSVA